MSEKEKPTPEPSPTPERSELQPDTRFDEATVDALEGPAIWESPQGDSRVRITGFAGSHEGRPYFEARGAGDPVLLPLSEIRFSKKRDREIRKAGVDLDALRETDYSQSPHEYERLYDAVPDAQKEQMVEAAHDEALELMGEAEDRYVEAELEKMRQTMEQAERHGVVWDEESVREMNRRTAENLEDNVPKEYLHEADTARRRPDELREAVEALVAAEPEETRDALASQAERWVALLEEHGEQASPQERAREAVDFAKESEEAFKESPHSPELQDELRERQFDAIEHRARELSGGEVTARALQAAREWMLKLIRTGQEGQYQETMPEEAANYAVSRIKAWRDGLFKGKRKWLTAGAIALGVIIPPVGAFALSVAVPSIAIFETGGALIHAGANLTEKGHKWALNKARERRVRRQLRFA